MVMSFRDKGEITVVAYGMGFVISFREPEVLRDAMMQYSS